MNVPFKSLMPDLTTLLDKKQRRFKETIVAILSQFLAEDEAVPISKEYT
jgi:hypothetical protein